MAQTRADAGKSVVWTPHFAAFGWEIELNILTFLSLSQLVKLSTFTPPTRLVAATRASVPRKPRPARSALGNGPPVAPLYCAPQNAATAPLKPLLTQLARLVS